MMTQAIALGLFYHQNKSNKNERDNTKRKRRNRLTILTQQFCETVSIDSNIPLGISELGRISSFFTKFFQNPLYQLMVLNGLPKTVDFKSEKQHKKYILNFIRIIITS